MVFDAQGSEFEFKEFHQPYEVVVDGLDDFVGLESEELYDMIFESFKVNSHDVEFGLGPRHLKNAFALRRTGWHDVFTAILHFFVG